jgi:hypothetical protein
VSHFSELRSELELLGSGRNVGLTEDMADALFTLVRTTSDSLASYVPSSIVRGPPDSVGGVVAVVACVVHLLLLC